LRFAYDYRRALVGALKNGSTFVISFQSLQHVNLAQFFDVSHWIMDYLPAWGLCVRSAPVTGIDLVLTLLLNSMYWLQEKTFPRAVMDRYAIFQEETWSKLLRPKEGVSSSVTWQHLIKNLSEKSKIICG
jgi:hypothetical protein